MEQTSLQRGNIDDQQSHERMFHRVRHVFVCVCMCVRLSDKNRRWKHRSNKHFGSSGTVSYTNKYALPKTAVKLLGNYPRAMKSYVHTKTCIQIFTTAFS